MNPNPARLWLTASLAIALAPCLAAQRAPANAPAAPTGVQKDEPIVLSPFEVGPESVRGYQSTAILQGGRGKIDLADVAGQVQVFTKDFLDDIGATTTDEAFLFSATTQTYFDNVNGNADSRPGSRNIADDSHEVALHAEPYVGVEVTYRSKLLAHGEALFDVNVSTVAEHFNGPRLCVGHGSD